MIQMEETDNRLIKSVSCQVQGSECVINWHWPESVPCVYVHKSRLDEPFDPFLLTQRDVKLYTREEYKANRGYREPVEGIGRYAYRIFPCELRDGKPVMLIPAGEDHIGRVSTGKAKIYYSVKRRKSWFRPYQSIQIRIFPSCRSPGTCFATSKKKAPTRQTRKTGRSTRSFPTWSPERT